MSPEYGKLSIKLPRFVVLIQLKISDYLFFDLKRGDTFENASPSNMEIF